VFEKMIESSQKSSSSKKERILFILKNEDSDFVKDIKENIDFDNLNNDSNSLDFNF
jgi:hypothetical protein